MSIETKEAVSDPYHTYYTSGLYQDRYPTANPFVLKTILDAYKADCLPFKANILDYGCGDGRYMLPLFHTTKANLIGYDVCQIAVSALQNKLRNGPSTYNRISLFAKEELLYECLDSRDGMDMILMLFGVLSHVQTKEQRQNLLKKLRSQLRARTGVLILSVPNRIRRFPWLQLRQTLSKFNEHDDGDITYIRRKGDQPISLFYHLYTQKEITQELSTAGYVVESVAAESILPEAWILKRQWISRLDRLLCRLLPASFGYGLLIKAHVRDPYDPN